MKAVSVANGLVAARIEAGMTQAHLAQAAGVSIRTVKRAEAGLNVASESVLALKAVLGDFEAKPVQEQKVVVRRVRMPSGVFGLRKVQRAALIDLPLYQAAFLLAAALVGSFDESVRWVGIWMFVICFGYYFLSLFLGLIRTPVFWMTTLLLQISVASFLFPAYVIDKIRQAGVPFSKFQLFWTVAIVLSFVYFVVKIARNLDKGLMYMYMRPDGRIRVKRSPMFSGE